MWYRAVAMMVPGAREIGGKSTGTATVTLIGFITQGYGAQVYKSINPQNLWFTRRVSKHFLLCETHPFHHGFRSLTEPKNPPSPKRLPPPPGY